MTYGTVTTAKGAYRPTPTRGAPVDNTSSDDVSGRSRSAAGGWSGKGYPEHGDFVRPRPSGNVHIAQTVTPYNARHARVELACGAAWSSAVLDPADGDHGRQCAACWDAM